MTYQHFIGIDIGKFEFAAAMHNSKLNKLYPNTAAGCSDLFDNINVDLDKTLIILENTGGYECQVIDFFRQKDIKVHRADTRKVKNFIRSYGQKGKTDKIDALALSLYGKERHHLLREFNPNDEKQTLLRALEERRMDLKQMLVQEKNRQKSPLSKPAISSISNVIKCLENEINIITSEIEEIIKKRSYSSKEKSHIN